MAEKTSVEQGIEEIVERVVDRMVKVIKREDAMVIVQSIIPELDKLISKRIKEHFLFLAEKTKEKFKE